MKKIKMLVLDIDGTIYKKDYTATETVKKTLKKLVNDGIKVVLATGRMYTATKFIAEELGLNTPVVSYQGGIIRNFVNDDEILYEKTMDTTLSRAIINELKKKDIYFNLYIDDVLMVEKDSQIIKDYVDARNIEYKIIGNCDDYDLTGLNKILAIDPDEKLIESLQKEMAEKYGENLYIIRSTPMFCEFSHAEATKGNAIRHLANMWDIKKEEIMACGDQDNDIEMLLAAGVKVAMGNATESLKEIADYVTETVDNDGVVCAVAKFIGEKYAI